MAWYDSILPPSSTMSDGDRKQLINGGLLQAGLQILGANSTPGVTPGMALSGGLLSGLNSVGQGAQQMQDQRQQAQDNQFKQASQQDQVQQMQRRHQIQDLATKFAKPDGTFDQQGYRNALYQIDPGAAQELDANDARQKLVGLQTQKAQRDINTPQTRELDQGNNKVTQEQQADGTWQTIATGSRFAPQQAQSKYQFVTGGDGNTYRANPQTGDIQPILGPDGEPINLTAGAKPGTVAGSGGTSGGGRGAAAQIKAFDQRNKMQQEANNGIDAAYEAAAQLTGLPRAQLEAMSPSDLESTIVNKGNSTAWGAALIHPVDTYNMHAYGTQAAMANAVLNSQGNKPTDADIAYGKDASFGVGKPLALNAKLIRQQVEKGQAIVNQINTLKTQFDLGGSLPGQVTQGGVGISKVPGSPNMPGALMSSPRPATSLNDALSKYGN